MARERRVASKQARLPRSTWRVVEHEAGSLSSSNEEVLNTIGQLPLVPIRPLVRLVAVRSSAAIYRRITLLERSGLLARLNAAVEGSGRPPKLLLLTNVGLAVTAWHHGLEPRRLARAWHLNAAGLDRLCRQLPALLAAYELLGLIAAATGATQRLRQWSWPWRWQAAIDESGAQTRIVNVSLPAYACLESEDSDGRRRATHYVLFADTGGLPVQALRPQLVRLGRLMRELDQDAPVVVVGTTSERRAATWYAVLADIASSRNSGPLLSTVATWESWQSGTVVPPATSGVRSPMRAGPLLEPDYQLRRRGPIPQPINLEAAQAAIRTYGLQASDRAVLDVVGRHPFLALTSLGLVLAHDTEWVRRRVSSLERRDLVRTLRQGCMSSEERVQDCLVEATVRGLAVLAESLGLSLTCAVRWHGLAGGGPSTPAGNRSALARHMRHTRGADCVFVSLSSNVRMCRRGGLMEWRNAAACARRRVRPDGYGLLQLNGREYGFFLEFDRGTVRPSALRAKFAAYQRYHSSGEACRDYEGFPTILVVTSGPGGEERLAEAARAAAQGHPARLPVLLTSTAWIESHPDGPLGSIWRTPESRLRQRWPAANTRRE